MKPSTGSVNRKRAKAAPISPIYDLGRLAAGEVDDV